MPAVMKVGEGPRAEDAAPQEATKGRKQILPRNLQKGRIPGDPLALGPLTSELPENGSVWFRACPARAGGGSGGGRPGSPPQLGAAWRWPWWPPGVPCAGLAGPGDGGSRSRTWRWPVAGSTDPRPGAGEAQRAALGPCCSQSVPAARAQRCGRRDSPPAPRPPAQTRPSTLQSLRPRPSTGSRCPVAWNWAPSQARRPRECSGPASTRSPAGPETIQQTKGRLGELPGSDRTLGSDAVTSGVWAASRSSGSAPPGQHGSVGRIGVS